MIKKRFYEIDILRVLSALSVMFFHYSFTAKRESFAPRADFEALSLVGRYGYVGINFFFVISGFIILYSLDGRTFKSFWKSRFLRLFPIYWIGLCLTTTMILLFGKDVFQVSLSQFLVNITMINMAFDIESIEPAYWTLFLEMKFYIFVSIIGFTPLKKLLNTFYYWF